MNRTHILCGDRHGMYLAYVDINPNTIRSWRHYILKYIIKPQKLLSEVFVLGKIHCRKIVKTLSVSFSVGNGEFPRNFRAGKKGFLWLLGITANFKWDKSSCHFSRTRRYSWLQKTSPAMAVLFDQPFPDSQRDGECMDTSSWLLCYLVYDGRILREAWFLD